MKISFTRDGWEDYTSWTNERTILKRINRMIEEAARDPATGIGKPERLSHNLSDYWSRRITDSVRADLGLCPTVALNSPPCDPMTDHEASV